jgi:hypothetical protein
MRTTVLANTSPLVATLGFTAGFETIRHTSCISLELPARTGKDDLL